MSARYRDGYGMLIAYSEACRIQPGSADGRWNSRARKAFLDRGLMLVPFAHPFLVEGPDLPMMAHLPFAGSDEPWPQSLIVWQDDDTIYSAAQTDPEKWVWQV